MKVPYVDIAGQHAPLKEELLAAVGRVVDHGKFILGPEVAEFEERFADLCRVRYAVGVNSGTDAMILALKALGVGPGDEVITAPNSFFSSAACIALLGARPVLVDVGEDYNIDHSLIEAAITPRTKAILPVHLTGRPAEMDWIMEIANAHGLYVVEDCAQAVMAEFRGAPVGSLGHVGCFSLHPLKTLNACGDGGVVTTKDPEIDEKLRTLRNIGLATRNECVAWSGNSRLDTIQAAILLVKLRYVEAWTAARQKNAQIYKRRLAGLPRVEAPEDKPHQWAVYHTFVIQADDRDGLKDHLAGQGVGTNIHYPVPIHLQKAAAGLGYGRGSFPRAERQAARILSLPVHHELSAEQVHYVADAIYNFYDQKEA